MDTEGKKRWTKSKIFGFVRVGNKTEAPCDKNGNIFLKNKTNSLKEVIKWQSMLP